MKVKTTITDPQEAQLWGEVATCGWKLYGLYPNPSKEEFFKLMERLKAVEKKLTVPVAA